MNAKGREIIHQAAEVYKRLGIRSVTMDDMARELSISKKTIYQYVKDKADLVKKVVEMDIASDEQCICLLEREDHNAIDTLFEISKFIGEQVKDLHPSIIFDLRKYYPEAWKVFESHKHGFVYDCILKNIEQGIAEGIYRSDLNKEIIAELYVGKLDIIFDKDAFHGGKFGLLEIYIEMLRYHIRGIASDKGIAYLKEKLKNEKLTEP